MGSEAKVDVNKKCHQGFNPLLTAAMEGKYHSHLSVINHSMMFYVMSGYRFCVTALLSSKFLDLTTSWQGMSPLTIAQQNGHRKIKEIILVRSHGRRDQ